MLKFKIYKYTNYNDLNEFGNPKVYIGQTSKETLNERAGLNGKGYCHKYKNGEYKQPKIAYAIMKYGWDSFIPEIIVDNINEEDVDELEKYYISLYDSINSGYNCDKGRKALILSIKRKNT